MASPATTSLDTLITLKVNHNGTAKRFKLPLRDLTMASMEDKIRDFLQLSPEITATIERYSDSAASFVVIERDNVQVYKQLFRAAKAKHKLKLRVTSPVAPVIPKPASVEDEQVEELTVAPTEQPSLIPVSSTTTNAAPEVPPKPLAYTLAPSTAQSSEETLQVEKTEMSVPAFNFCKRPFTVCCNKCDKAVPDAHFHCSICDDGDFDLCQECVTAGVTCNDDSHWLIKRTIKDGEITQSTTARLMKKKTTVAPTIAAVPTLPPVIMDLPIRPLEAATCRASLAPTWSTAYNARTCNGCVQEFPEQDFVHCTTCDDFDLCKGCFAKDQHGHHPKHAFTAAAKDAVFDQAVSTRLASGRNVLHNAICDGCEHYVRGVRHKCLDCPDWDYCSECVLNAEFIHPNHRFVPIYEPLAHPTGRSSSTAAHYGIRCDGPHCAGRRGVGRYITGDRFKCAVCHDTDFCANCEASPANTHNKTHPLIKFKTPVRHVNVTTVGEHEDGQRLPVMGDRTRCRATRVPASKPSSESIAASPVQTVVDVKPTEAVVAPEPAQLSEPVVPAAPSPDIVAPAEPARDAELIATFQRDSVTDGTILPPNHTFEQTWVLRNEGTTEWPAGCAVKFVGGDYMGAIDPAHPAGLHELVSASESTVCYHTLQPGQEFSFTVLMRTPDREGKVISYWRLTTSDGQKFGHKLWCDIKVVKPVVIEATEPVETTRSQMIIPKLEHESPSASIIHEDRTKTETVTETITETASQATLDRAEDDFEDCTEVDNWADDSDDGFLTDEEYDILDASDEEYLSGAAIRK